MFRILQFIAFILVFLSVYGSVNAYVIWRLNNLFGNQFTRWTILIILFSTVSYLLGSLIERLAHNLLTRFIYGVTATWMGILFFLFITLLIYEVLKYFVKIPEKQALVGVLIVVGFISAYAIRNAFEVNVKEISIPLKNLEQNVKLVQLTDLHVGTINNSKFLKNVVEQVNALEPDFVAITGDLVDGSGPLRLSSYEYLNQIKAPIYFVIGNHEVYEDQNKVLELLKEIDLKVLLNQKIETNGIELMGVTFAETTQENALNLNKIEINQNKPSVLLAHNPNLIQLSSQKGIDLQLSGHTHNGQIYPFNFLVKLFYPYIQGLYDYQGTILYVSPGTGTWGPLMRLGSRNEITVINLISLKKS